MDKYWGFIAALVEELKLGSFNIIPEKRRAKTPG